MTASVVDIHKKKGIRPEYDVYIGRQIRYRNQHTFDLREFWYEPSKWHNPNLRLNDYKIYIEICIEKEPEKYDLNELRGKRLGCWCITTDSIENPVCHGQILMKLIAEGVEK